MDNTDFIAGRSLDLRLITENDAGYVHALRTDPAFNTHLSKVTGTIADQRQWIDSYKFREIAKEEFYYVIQRKDGQPCGLVRLYDLTPTEFTWGSWMLGKNKPSKAALESAILSFGVGFQALNKTKAHIAVQHSNSRAISFYRRFGMMQVSEDENSLHFVYLRDWYLRDMKCHLSSLPL